MIYKTFNSVLPCAGHEEEVVQRLGRRLPESYVTVEAVEGGVRVVSPGALGTPLALQNLGEELALARAEYAPGERWDLRVEYRDDEDLKCPFFMILHAGPGRVDEYEEVEEP